jgi:DNA invertase Pin-like site-specific DNA recombinase
MHCAAYARVNTTDQNCEMQLLELREYISRRGWTIAGEYVDTGFSGAKASRPSLDRLMADAAQRKFDCIVVYKIDRFGRSVLRLNQQLVALTSYGVRFIATSQSLDTDQSNPTSRLLLQILAGVAEFERWLHSMSYFRLFLVTLPQREVRLIGRLSDSDWESLRKCFESGFIGA